MARLRIAVRVCMYNMRRLLTEYRAYTGMALALFAVVFYCNGVRDVCVHYSAGVSPVQVFTHLLSYPQANSFLYLGWITLMCDAPFVSDVQISVVMRSGRKEWFGGQMLYILAMALLYWISIAVMIAVMFIGYWGDFGDWGRVIHTFSVSSIKAHNIVSEKVMKSYSVFSAVSWTYLLHVGASVLLALMMFWVNMVSNRNHGGVVAVIFALFEMAFTGFGLSPQFYYFSPITLSNLSTLDIQKVTYKPSDTYAAVFMLAGNVLLIAVCYIIYRRSNVIASYEF